MKPTAPPATGVRLPWERLPETVRDAVTGVLGAPVVHAVTQPGGFSPGAAVRVRTATGRRAFVKAVGADTNPGSPGLHRAEARLAAALPAAVPAPRLLGAHDDGTWVALVFEEVAGHQPSVPWRPSELRRVLDAVGRLGGAFTPAPVAVPPAAEALRDAFDGRRRLLDDDRTDHRGRPEPWAAARLAELTALAAPWPEAVTGDTLAHGDLRADNILLTGGRDDGVVFVDWPHAMRAAPWVDLLLMLPCVSAQGGPDPEELFTAHPLGRAADPAAVTAALAAFAGCLAGSALRPAPPGLPTLRAFQRAQGEAAPAWLRTRLSRSRLRRGR
ncbi:phosphotransferase family protein [Streptomyces tropicalis]|uniref:Phosphotransferase n=1 Tax=Streptomyces tropicalis TaxID=3034234 RepID=A0ABT6A594_9ACTN|nr:phosphotransferase [Streptomyces tropicalis]MDF3299816.1 phosphotransferase [Streptomyces tropicalis]